MRLFGLGRVPKRAYICYGFFHERSPSSGLARMECVRALVVVFVFDQRTHVADYAHSNIIPHNIYIEAIRVPPDACSREKCISIANICFRFCFIRIHRLSLRLTEQTTIYIAADLLPRIQRA